MKKRTDWLNERAEIRDRWKARDDKDGTDVRRLLDMLDASFWWVTHDDKEMYVAISHSAEEAIAAVQSEERKTAGEWSATKVYGRSILVRLALEQREHDLAKKAG